MVNGAQTTLLQYIRFGSRRDIQLRSIDVRFVIPLRSSQLSPLDDGFWPNSEMNS